ncbi:alpha/beta hydrolase [Branchiibius sp. NY16-3462-2]|uniref:alpha/beta fold hydrolase n=1 Tax=Branchiibius sp. NY16-3462-2 TaxID=1807500 RepID=UPI0007919003|nr:alpha/beta hydrolase [Branchiibius sp. NY16-3462-2]KYH43387.1 hypothetical protein AZH51_16640 [Branchiibius sp. NY16-3462-2]
MTVTWEAADQYVELLGLRVRYRTWGNPDAGTTYVLVHGLGGSLENWGLVAPYLADADGYVYALDLAGFGQTVPQHYRQARVGRNVELVEEFLRSVVGRPAVIVGNSMGGLISLRVAGRARVPIKGAVLVDPLIPLSPRHRPHPLVAVAFTIYTVPGLNKAFLRLRSGEEHLEDSVEEALKLVTTDVDKIDPEVRAAHLDLARSRLSQTGTAESFLAAAHTTLLHGVRRRDYTKHGRSIAAPVLLLHGDRDRLINVGTARGLARRHPEWTYVEGPGIGHTPMLDEPEWVADNIREWVEKVAAAS